MAMISPVSTSLTIHAEATTSLLTRKPDGAVTPHAAPSTAGRGVGAAWPGANRSEVVVGSSGTRECGQESVSGAVVRVGDEDSSSSANAGGVAARAMAVRSAGTCFIACLILDPVLG